MTTRAQHSHSAEAKEGDEGVVDEGAERYLWVFLEGNRVVLAIPGLRGLRFSIDEARTVGDMLIQAADEIEKHLRIMEESGDDNGSSEEPATEG